MNLLRKLIFGLSIGLFGGEYSAWLSAYSEVNIRLGYRLGKATVHLMLLHLS